MMRLLDTDILVDLVRGYLPAHAWVAAHAQETFGVPGFVIMELIKGTRNQRELRRLLRGIANWTVVWPTQVESERALDTYARFRLSHNLSAFDALIGETAAGLGATLCTFNVKHFRPLVHVTTEQPYAR